MESCPSARFLCLFLGSCFKLAVLGPCWEKCDGRSFQDSQLEDFSGVFSSQAIAAGVGAIVHEKHCGKLSVSLGILCAPHCPLPPLMSLFSCPVFLSSPLWFQIS